MTTKWQVSLALAGLLAGCGDAGDLAPGQPSTPTEVASLGQAIADGTLVPIATRTPLELSVVHVYTSVGSCTGTLVRTNWVLTARHCVTLGTGAIVPSATITHDMGLNQASAAIYTHPDSAIDAALVKLGAPMNAGQQAVVPLFTGGDPDVIQHVVTSYGYGGVSDLSRKAFNVAGINRNDQRYSGKYLLFGPNTPGDSGGPAFLNGQIVGITGGVDKKAYARSFRNWANSFLSPATNNRIDATRTQWGTNWAPAGTIIRTGDFDGDGRADVVQFNQDSGPRGAVYVIRNVGGSRVASQWHSWFSIGSQIPATGDVDGDGKDDIITFDQSNASVYVALSTGSQFVGTGQIWHSGFSFAGETPRVADVNGDGRADVITFVHYQNWGAVWVSLSCGTDPSQYPQGCTGSNQFGARINWANGFSLLNEVPYLGDVNGDGLADLVTFGNGSASVALTQPRACVTDADCGGWCWTAKGYCPASLGGPAGTKTLWGSGYYPNIGETPMIADINGDGYADAVDFETVASGRNGYFGVGLSNGSGAFGSYSVWSTQVCRQGEVCAVGDVNLDGRADVFDFTIGGADRYALSLP